MRAYLFTLSIFLFGILVGQHKQKPCPINQEIREPVALNFQGTYPRLRSVWSVNQVLNKP
jgi:hypothetical protein